MLRPGVLLAPGSDLALRRTGHYPRGFHQASPLRLMRDWLRGRMGSCHGRTTSDWISWVTGCTTAYILEDVLRMKTATILVCLWGTVIGSLTLVPQLFPGSKGSTEA